MRDTIGAHLAEAHTASINVSTCIHLAGEATTHESVEFYALKRAKWEGAAAGHAFRAAELAYDLGQQQGRGSVLRDWERADEHLFQTDPQIGMPVHWNGEE